MGIGFLIEPKDPDPLVGATAPLKAISEMILPDKGCPAADNGNSFNVVKEGGSLYLTANELHELP